MAKFKGASSPKASDRKHNYVQRKAVFAIKKSGSQLTREDTLGQKGAFSDVAENKSGIQKSKYTGKFVPERRCTNAENSRSGLSLALRSR